MPPKRQRVEFENKSVADASTGTEDKTESIKETLNAKTKEELVDELAKLINVETTPDNTCNSDNYTRQYMQ